MTRQDTFVVITIYSTKSANFWPHSRRQKPKQFLDLLGNGRSLVQLTYERSKGICPEENIYVLVPKDYTELLRQQLPNLSDDQILEEPVRRNSAPSIAYACYKIRKKEKNAVIVVCPSDHAIFGEIAYVRDVRKAVEIASNDHENLMIIGIKPHKAETSYGYIQYHHDSKSVVKKVKTFTKKPQPDLAKLFLESGDFAWNTKIFVWHMDAITKAFQHFTPDVHETFWEGSEYYYTDEEAQFIFKAYAHCNNVSISNNIMEKAENINLLLGEFDWSDLNSWQSLYDVKEKQKNDNIIEGTAYMHNSKQCLVKGDKQKLIVVEGLKNYLIIDSKDALLICPKSYSENIRNLTNTVKELKNEKYL